MKRIIALNHAIESFKLQLAEEIRNTDVIGQIELARRSNDEWPRLNGGTLKQCGVYIYTDLCDQRDPFKPPPDGAQQTVIRYIGSTRNTFNARFSTHKLKDRFNWTWWKVVCFSRDYSHFAPALETFLLKQFHPTHENSSTESNKVKRYKFSGPMMGLPPQDAAMLSRFRDSMFDETADKPSELHKQYFGK